MKFSELKSSSRYDASKDAKCAHCMISFEDDDELGQCALTDHFTHAVCVCHDR